MKKGFLIVFTFMALFTCLFGLSACGEDSSGGSTSDSIDYSKYNYYGNYSFRSNLSNGGTLELNFKLGKDNEYEMTLDVYSVNGLRLVDVTEGGSYSMSTLDEPIFDETMNVIYMLLLTPYLSTGFANYESVNGFYGYITEGFYMDYWWCYIDHYQYGASVYFGKDGNQYKAEYSKLKYEVTYIASAGGKINGYTNQSIIEGEDTVEVTAVPDYGYAFNRWSDGVTTATRKESNVNSDIEVTANFVEALPKYTLTYTYTDGGTLQGELSQTLFQGLDGTKVTAVPNKRLYSEDYPYQFIEWSDGVKTAERTDLNVQGNMSVTAIFKPQFRYYAENCAGGRIEISTDTANYANNYTVTATAIADEGWVFVEWKDGVKTETRTDVLTSDTSVQAVFAREINVIATTGGKIINREEVTAERQITLHIKPPTNLETIYYIQAIADEGYKFVGWSSSENGSYIANINETEMIDFYFDYNTYYAIFAANGEQGGQSGGISGDNNQEDGNSGATEDDNQDNATQDYELVYVYSEKLQGYSVAGINMYSESETLYDVTIPSTYRSVAVKGIDDSAFAYCSALKSVTIENGITIIGQFAFAGCTSLINVELPNSINKLVDAAGADPFMNCSSLKHNIKDGLKYLGSSDNPYLYLRGRADGRVITSATIDDNCKIIGGSAFYNCSSLTGIVIPERLVSIGDWAFAECSSLTSIVIPDSVTSIGYSAFYYCTSLTSVVIGDSVNSIGYNAFYDCTSLTSIKYRGTEEEWSTINKEYGWDYNIGNYTIEYNYNGD